MLSSVTQLWKFIGILAHYIDDSEPVGLLLMLPTGQSSAAAAGQKAESPLILLRCSEDDCGFFFVFSLVSFLVLIVTGSLYLFCWYLFVCLFTSLCRV